MAGKPQQVYQGVVQEKKGFVLSIKLASGEEAGWNFSKAEYGGMSQLKQEKMREKILPGDLLTFTSRDLQWIIDITAIERNGKKWTIDKAGEGTPETSQVPGDNGVGHEEPVRPSGHGEPTAEVAPGAPAVESAAAEPAPAAKTAPITEAAPAESKHYSDYGPKSKEGEEYYKNKAKMEQAKEARIMRASALSNATRLVSHGAAQSNLSIEDLMSEVLRVAEFYMAAVEECFDKAAEKVNNAARQAAGAGYGPSR